MHPFQLAALHLPGKARLLRLCVAGTLFTRVPFWPSSSKLPGP